LHANDLLSPVIHNENGRTVPAAILRKFLGKNNRMRGGVVGTGKDRSRLVRVPAAVVNMEIKPDGFGQDLCLRYVEYTGSRRETLGMTLGCVLQWDAHQIHDGIESIGEASTDLLVNTKENIVIRRIDKPHPQNIANPALQHEIIVPLALP
jgi:hypothetical protein